MTPTDKVLGQIAAINTFIENFPISILDMMHGKVYTSIFDFMIDVLCACGVDINEVIGYLLREIYGLEANINGGFEGFYEQIKNGNYELNEQNEFLEGLETSIKIILMGLLSSIYTCSAVPILPNKVFDGPNEDSFSGNTSNAFNFLQQKDTFPPFLVPTSAIDPMGLLDIAPTSNDGRLFYAVEGGDKYYHKDYDVTYVTVTKKREIEINEPQKIQYYSAWTENLFESHIGLFIKTTEINDNSGENWNFINITSSATSDLHIIISYSPYGSKVSYEWEGDIKSGDTSSPTPWICSPSDRLGQLSVINSITINGNNGGGADIGNKTWVYLDSGESKDFIDVWKGADSLPWDIIKNETIQYTSAWTKTYDEPQIIEEEYEDIEEVYTEKYFEVFADEVPMDAVQRVNNVPLSPTLDDPEYIVCYEGLNPNTLYRTYDMNAFLWYVLHKGMKNPQVEYNHMMWDSRVSAAKQNIKRKNNSEWNEWYNSKSGYTAEFKYFGSTIVEDTPIFPIIQLEGQGMSENLFRVHIPAQRYFLPKVRNANIERTDVPIHAFNASIYKYNWDYLNNIQILNPKMLIVGLCEYLLGFSLSTIASVNVNLTKKIIEAKLSKAIKSIIESNDMEVENCYMEFSNDEVNMMMEEMMLSRYNATMYGGETATVRVHDTQKYIAMLDQVNANASSEGNITALTKLVTEVTSNPGTESSIEYGLQVTTDGNLLKKLLWAIVMPILLSIFTPQVLLLLYINFDLMGITRSDEVMGQDMGKILNVLMNKIFGLLKSIILAIKDKIVELLLILFYKTIAPLMLKFTLILLRERVIDWLIILRAALNCLPQFKFTKNKVIGAIDNVDYADIINTQNTPESTTNC